MCGSFFRAPSPYTPFAELESFLKAGPPPIYIGFGSIVMENPEQMTQTILDAVQTSGVRAIVSESWSKLDSGLNDSKDVLFIGDCPHAM